MMCLMSWLSEDLSQIRASVNFNALTDKIWDRTIRQARDYPAQRQATILSGTLTETQVPLRHETSSGITR